MILEMCTMQTSTLTLLESMLRLVTRPNKLWPKSIHTAQLVSSHHQKISNMMFHIRCWSLWLTKTKMISMILEMCTMQTSTLTLLESMLRSVTRLNKLWPKSILIAQLVSSHHLKTSSMKFHIRCWSLWSMRIKMTSMILEMYTMQTSTLTLLESMLRLVTRPNKLWPKSILTAQLVSSHHQKISNMMFHIRCWSLWLTKTKMISMILEMCTMQTSTLTLLESMLRSVTRLNKLWPKSILIAQLVSSHHLKTSSMKFHIRCWSLWSMRIKMTSMILETCTIQTSTRIPLENMHKKINLWPKSIHTAQLVSSHHQRISNMRCHIRCLSHWLTKTKMTSMILEMCTTQTSTLTL